MFLKILKRILYIVIFILPFVFGTIGYYVEGETFFNALYGAFTLYVINPVSDVNNWMIMIAKWGAPFMLSSGVLMIVKGLLYRIQNFWISLHKRATAIYSDNDYGNILSANLKYGILVENSRVCDVKEHILLFSKDMDNLNFYQKNRTKFQGKKVYILLHEADSFLLRESTVHFFNINESIARRYWQTFHLMPYFEKGNLKIQIAIVGFAALGQNILNYGLLNNIYDLHQQITYHIWGDSCLYEKTMDQMKLMNQDRIIYHGENWQADVQMLAAMDRVIVTEENQLQLLQTLMYLCHDTEIHYYNSGDALLEDIYQKEQLVLFGRLTDILTEQNIKADELNRAAKEVNYRYACMYGNVSGDAAKEEVDMEEQWEKLDGFTKGSNIACADYHAIRRMIMRKAREKQMELSIELLGQLEHIRWCRFHYLNHWTYGIPENGKAKDSSQRIHTCLVPFEELSEEERKKDYDAVEVLLDLMPV